MADKLTYWYAFRIYYTIRKHFLTDYNINDYNWRFLRPHEYDFEKTAWYPIFRVLANHKIKLASEWIDIIIVSLLEKQDVSPYDLMTNYSYWKDQAKVWRGRISNMPYIFEQESRITIRELFENNFTFDSLFPGWLLGMFLHRRISVEVFIIFKKILKFSLDGFPDYEYLYKDQYQKYELILNINTEKYKEILKSIITDEISRRNAM
jgi:hypothetical protein